MEEKDDNIGIVCSKYLYGMSGSVINNIQHGASMKISMKYSVNILLTGTCWYELTGLCFLLLAQGYSVSRVPLGYSCTSDKWDLVIVALSAEPITGWGKHLSWICEVRSHFSGKMLVLVPERLNSLKILGNTCLIYSGCRSLSQLGDNVIMALSTKVEKNGIFHLTAGQHRALKRLSGKGKSSALNLKKSDKKFYWHYAQLADNVGVRDLKMLLMTGLDKEIIRMERMQYILQNTSSLDSR